MLIYKPAQKLGEVLGHAVTGEPSLFNVLTILRVHDEYRVRPSVSCRIQAVSGEHINS